MLEPAPRPMIGPGADGKLPVDDARVAWKKEEARADENAARLVISRENYDGVRATYSGKGN